MQDIDNLIIRAKQKINEYNRNGLNIDKYYNEIMNNYIEKALDIEPNNSRLLEFKIDFEIDYKFELERKLSNEKIDKSLVKATKIINEYRYKYTAEYVHQLIVNDYGKFFPDLDPKNEKVQAIIMSLKKQADNDRNRLQAMDSEAKESGSRILSRLIIGVIIVILVIIISIIALTRS